MLNMKVNVYFKKDTLRGHDCNEIRVELKEIVKDRYEEDDWNFNKLIVNIYLNHYFWIFVDLLIMYKE